MLYFVKCKKLMYAEQDPIGSSGSSSPGLDSWHSENSQSYYEVADNNSNSVESGLWLDSSNCSSLDFDGGLLCAR